MIEKLTLSDGKEVIVSNKKNVTILHPIKKDLNKPFSLSNCDWKNFLVGGNWMNLFWVLIFLGVVFLGVYGYYHDVGVCMQIQKDPWSYCQNVSGVLRPTGDKPYNLNLSSITSNITIGYILPT